MASMKLTCTHQNYFVFVVFLEANGFSLGPSCQFKVLGYDKRFSHIYFKQIYPIGPNERTCLYKCTLKYFVVFKT